MFAEVDIKKGIHHYDGCPYHFHSFIGLLVYWFIGVLVYWYTGLLVHQYTNPPVNQSTNHQSPNQPITTSPIPTCPFSNLIRTK